MQPHEIITRRNLPHWYVPGAMHFVTYRLAGAIPQNVLYNLREARRKRLAQKPGEKPVSAQNKALAHKLFFAGYDRYLDRSSKIDWLTKPPIAALIRGSLYFHRGSKYQLLSYCVMPNHVHVLLQPMGETTQASPQARTLVATEEHDSDERPDVQSPLAVVMHNLKGYTAHEANKVLGRSGQFWQHESYDHWVRDEEELERIVDYIAWNPVKAGLVKEPHEWLFSSAHDRFLQDGSKETYLY